MIDQLGTNMKPPTRCPTCGNPIPSDSPDGHCPHCLLQHALGAANTAPSTPVAPRNTILLSSLGPMPAAPGDKVRYFGDYEILEAIAHGGMGVVYKARQVSLNRTVAVKMILAGRLAGEDEVRRFLAEAEAAANLQHPNIVAIHEVGQHQGQHYFSMDYVNGPNLAQWAKNRSVSPPDAARVVMTLARAVHCAHQRGTLHRDLKPHNVLMDESGQPRITDFGLAKRMAQSSQLTQEGAVLGSPSYMPPEQATGRQDQVGPASDVYSLGAILYELLTGCPPFGPGPFTAVLQQVIEQEPVAPSHLNRQVPTDLETICLKCLEKRMERRYSSARDLADELERFLREEPILARPASAARKTWSWLVRNPWALVGVSVTLMLGLTGLAYGLWEQNRYLVWVHLHPNDSFGKAKALLGHSLFMPAWLGFCGGLFFFCTFLACKQRGMAIGPKRLWGYAGIGTLLVLGSIVFCVATIHDRIWRLRAPDSDNPLATLFPLATSSMVLVCAWLGGLLLFHVVREFRIRTLGLRPADEEQLFLPAASPRAGKFSVADRRGWNLLLAVVLLAVWLYRLLNPDMTAQPEAQFAQLLAILAAAQIPLWLEMYRRVRRVAFGHVPLWLAAASSLLVLGYVAPWKKENHEVLERLAVVAGSLGFGTVVAIGWARLAKAQEAGAFSVPEEAWFEGRANTNGSSSWVGLLAICLLVSMAPTALLGGLPIRPALAIVVTFLALLPHEFVCLLRSKGLERKGRLFSVLLVAVGAFSAAFGLPVALAAKGAAAGFMMGLVLLAFVFAKSRNLQRAGIVCTRNGVTH